MTVARESHTATLLNDGRVLITGGFISGAVTNDTRIFDPVSNSFSAGPLMAGSRGNHTATLGLTGRVVIIGGFRTGPFYLKFHRSLRSHDQFVSRSLARHISDGPESAHGFTPQLRGHRGDRWDG